MKKKSILTIAIILVFTLTLFMATQNDEKVIYESGITSIEASDALAMMYETGAGSGEYVVSDDTTWPQEGYVFNAELSGCENGSALYWDEETHSVMMEANVSDKCYVYFDKIQTYTLESNNTMEVYYDDEGQLIASAVRTQLAGGGISEALALTANVDISNITIRIRYNPSASVYKGRTTISYDFGNSPLMVDTGADKYADGEPIIFTGSLNAGDGFVIRLQRNNYRPDIDANIDFIITGDGL